MTAEDGSGGRWQLQRTRIMAVDEDNGGGQQGGRKGGQKRGTVGTRDKDREETEERQRRVTRGETEARDQRPETRDQRPE